MFFSEGPVRGRHVDEVHFHTGHLRPSGVQLDRGIALNPRANHFERRWLRSLNTFNLSFYSMKYSIQNQVKSFRLVKVPVGSLPLVSY